MKMTTKEYDELMKIAENDEVMICDRARYIIRAAKYSVFEVEISYGEYLDKLLNQMKIWFADEMISGNIRHAEVIHSAIKQAKSDMMRDIFSHPMTLTVEMCPLSWDGYTVIVDPEEKLKFQKKLLGLVS